MSEHSGIRTETIGHYRSERDAPSCYEIACLYADMHDDYGAFCAVEYMRMELEHYTGGVYETTANTTELELLVVCKQLESQGIEFVLVERESS